jgi:triosephosphate isomerase
MPDNRRPFFAANWKMHKGPREAAEFVADFAGRHVPRPDACLVFFPPAISVTAFREAAAARPDIEIGIQDVHEEPAGAHTGATAARMAREAGATWALAGHSERRREFGDDATRVAAKVARILEAEMRPILCVGETLEQRERGELRQVLALQVGAVLRESGGVELTYAYEPVWAIGTGRTASPEDVAGAHDMLRKEIDRCGGDDGASILYGGSVKPSNIESLLSAPGVDGVLVGGASLDPESFTAICAAGA